VSSRVLMVLLRVLLPSAVTLRRAPAPVVLVSF
jgi:hypothetical protein